MITQAYLDLSSALQVKAEGRILQRGEELSSVRMGDRTMDLAHFDFGSLSKRPKFSKRRRKSFLSVFPKSLAAKQQKVSLLPTPVSAHYHEGEYSLSVPHTARPSYSSFYLTTALSLEDVHLRHTVKRLLKKVQRVHRRRSSPGFFVNPLPVEPVSLVYDFLHCHDSSLDLPMSLYLMFAHAKNPYTPATLDEWLVGKPLLTRPSKGQASAWSHQMRWAESGGNGPVVTT